MTRGGDYIHSSILDDKVSQAEMDKNDMLLQKIFNVKI
jgi:hypothetical protein